MASWSEYIVHLGLQNNFWELVFFKFFSWYERTRLAGHKNRGPRSQQLTLDFEKIPEGLKMDQKSLNYFRVLTTWFELWFTQSFFSVSRYFFPTFATYAFYIKNKFFCDLLNEFFYMNKVILKKNRTLKSYCEIHLKTFNTAQNSANVKLKNRMWTFDIHKSYY